MCFVAFSLQAQHVATAKTDNHEATPADEAVFVDLGLPSGTLWKDENEKGFREYDFAVKKYGEYLPTKEQWQELVSECNWTWTGKGYKVVGPNGASIELPLTGLRYHDGGVDLSPFGCYLSSDMEAEHSVYTLYFNSEKVEVRIGDTDYGLTSRLVKMP